MMGGAFSAGHNAFRMLIVTNVEVTRYGLPARTLALFRVLCGYFVMKHIF
jgi:hypothetical protein